MLYGLKLVRKKHSIREYVVTDKKLCKLLFRKGTIDAYYVEGAIYYRTKKLAHNKRVRRHELEHARQERFLGREVFQALYRWSQVFFGYQHCPFETAARLKSK